MREFRKAIVIAIIFGILGLIIGFVVGQAQAISFCVETGLKVLELNNISIEVNKELIKTAFFQYKNNIGML